MIAVLPALSLLVVGSVVALHLEESEGVTAAETELLIGTLAETWSASHQVVDSRKIQLTCPTVQRCGIEIVARTGATQVIYLRIFGIPSKIRLIAESAGISRGSATVDLPRDQYPWKIALEKFAAELIPAPAPQPAPIAKQPTPALVAPIEIQDTRTYSIGPYIAIGAGAAFGIAAVVVGLENRSAVREGEMSSDPARVEALRGTVSDTGLAANLLIGAAITSAIGGVSWWVLDQL